MHLIRKGLWSTTYRNGSVFVKKLNFWEPAAAEREAKASQTAYDHGIFTPRYLSTMTEQGNQISLLYEYTPMKKLSIEDVLFNSTLFEQLMRLLKQVSEIQWEQKDEYWYRHITKEFEYELSLLNFNTRKYSDLLHSLIPSVFIHGDFSVFNMGLVGDKLMIFDFQHGSYGPNGWDKAYFASTMRKELSSVMTLTPLETQMAELIAAVKLGRAVKKGLIETPLRNKIFESWKTD